MKNLILTLLLILSCSLLQAQEEIGKSYKTKVPLNLEECKLNGAKEKNTKAAPSGSKFTVVNIIKGQSENDFVYIISFWDWEDKYVDNNKNKGLATSNSNSKYFTLNYNASDNTHKYFKLTASQLKYVCSPLVARIQPTAGTLILPLKFRFNPTDFSKDLTFSGTGGLRFNLQKNTDVSFSVVAGVGISSVTIDSSSTEGEVSESTDLAAATVLGGVLMEWKILQIGVFTGADWLARKDINNWCYQGKPWLGVGIGISLFTREKSTVKETQNTN